MMNNPIAPPRHSEAAFESVIEEHLLKNGYCHIQDTFDPAKRNASQSGVLGKSTLLTSP